MDRDDRPWYVRPGWVVSAALHAGIVALTFFSWPTTYDDLPQPDFVPVELLEIADTTNVRAAAKSEDPKPEPTPAAKPDPKPKAAPNPKPEPPPPPPPEPEPEPVAEPEPAPAEPAPAPDTAEVEPEPAPAPPDPQPAPPPPTPRAKPKEVKEPPKEVAEADPKPTPEKKPEKKPEKPKDPPPEDDKPFDPDAVIAGLEDKEDTDTTSDSAPEEKKAEDEKPQKGIGDPSRATATIIDAFKTQVSRCWSPPMGAPSPEKLIVLIRVRLNRDGSLNGMPEYRDQSAMSDPYYRAAAEAGRRAIMGCQNYQLPAESYDLWKVLDVEFDPSKMIGL